MSSKPKNFISYILSNALTMPRTSERERESESARQESHYIGVWNFQPSHCLSQCTPDFPLRKKGIFGLICLL